MYSNFPLLHFLSRCMPRLKLGSRCSVIQLPKEQAAKAAAQLWHDNPVDLRITTVSKSVRMDGFRVQDCLDYDKDLKWYLSKCDKPSAAKAEGSETSADEEERGCRAREQGSYLPRSGISLEFRIRSVRGRGPSVRAFPAKPVEGAGMVGEGRY